MIDPERAEALISGFEDIEGVRFASVFDDGQVYGGEMDIDLERDGFIAVRCSCESGALFIVLSRNILDGTLEELEAVGDRYAETITSKLLEKAS